MNAPYLRGAIYEIFQRNARQIELRKPSSLNFGGHSQARRINHKTVTFCNSQEATKQEHNSAKPVILSHTKSRPQFMIQMFERFCFTSKIFGKSSSLSSRLAPHKPHGPSGLSSRQR